MPGYRLILSDKNEVFISLDKLNEDCVERIRHAITNKISIEEYLNNFTKHITTKYEKKKPARLIIESDSQEVKPQKKKKLIIEDTTPVSPEEYILKPKKKQSRKNINIKGNNITMKQGKKKRRLLIVDSADTEKV